MINKGKSKLTTARAPQIEQTFSTSNRCSNGCQRCTDWRTISLVPTKTLAATAPATKRVTALKRVTYRDLRAPSAGKMRITGIAIADIIILSDQFRIINPTIKTAYDLRIELKYAAQKEPRTIDTQVFECDATYLEM